ncbi:hypothetical protein PMAYCL1PPCAC_33267, partial [Pristionchus mayeri]
NDTWQFFPSGDPVGLDTPIFCEGPLLPTPESATSTITLPSTNHEVSSSTTTTAAATTSIPTTTTEPSALVQTTAISTQSSTSQDESKPNCIVSTPFNGFMCKRVFSIWIPFVTGLVVSAVFMCIAYNWKRRRAAI